MPFTTSDFAIFFVVTVALFFACPPRYRYILLLILSYIFIATSDVRFVLVLFASTFANFVLARLIASTQNARQKNVLLLLDIVFNLGMLLTFKYLNFFQQVIAGILATIHVSYSPVLLQVILPLGLSFYTFQQIAYNVDVYRGRLKPETNFGVYAVFVAFFPHLTSGPIDRGSNLLPQFRRDATFDPVRVTEGCRLILFGVFKKLVVADRLGTFVDPVYTNPQNFKGIVLLLATFFYAFQLYADFSGYSDIAIGTARILGFQIAINFQQPYFSLSIREFWQRWHMSLSSWIRDYMFFPLTRKSIQITKGKYQRATQLAVSVIVMGLVGLWHGANITFIVWGILHGIYLGFESIFRGPKQTDPERLVRKRLLQVWNWTRTFALLLVAWVFFRAASMVDATYITRHIFSPTEYSLNYLLGFVGSRQELLLPFALVIVLLLLDLLDRTWGMNILLNRMPLILRWSIYYAVILSFFLFAPDTTPQFIYFRF